MISSWLIKLVLGIALFGFAVIELGSPLVARAQADDAAHAVADAAAFTLVNQRGVEAMHAECGEESERQSVKLLSCELDGQGRVAVTVGKTARSFLLHKFEPTKDWYEVTASATSKGPAR